ncbi:hypothetical protein PM082_017259 [Marasmius tenuissimus]|nr:hypothetical protein PM082_017259 [Marasmius tenuissimus]
MNLRTSLLFLFGFLCLGGQGLVSALRVPDSLFKSFDTNRSLNDRAIIARDVYSPKITNPTRNNVWIVGLNATIEWDTSKPPQNITNDIGEILLGRFNGTDDNEHLDLEHPLAENFSLLSGSVTVEVPDVEPGEDYFIVLFGDSGNRSPLIRIQNQQPGPLLPRPLDILRRFPAF